MSSKKNVQSVFGLRLKSARVAIGLSQDKLGVQVGLEESSSSARMSRYESGVHEPSFLTAMKIAQILKVPTAYFYCEDDELAKMILMISCLDTKKRADLMLSLKKLLPDNSIN